MGAFLTYALDEGGALVHVDDVAKGAKCAVTAPIAMLLFMQRMPEHNVSTILHTLMGTNVKERMNLPCTC